MRSFQPKKGFIRNKITKYRNAMCICGSQKKVKKCCGNLLYVPEKLEKVFQAFVDLREGKISVIKFNAVAARYERDNQVKPKDD